MKIVVADPAKNITVFVLDHVEDPMERSVLAQAILAEKSLKAEQVGFVIPPEEENSGAESGDCQNKRLGRRQNRGIWRLEMAGGEFCGNAARSFGLYLAGLKNLKGKAKVLVSISGAEEPVSVKVDTGRNFASAEMPKPTAEGSLDYKCAALPVYVFEGITHVIAPDIIPSVESFSAIKLLTEKNYYAAGLSTPAAIGVMFFDTVSRFMCPVVFVRAASSLVFESSCGSGSAALGIWLSRELNDGVFRFPIAQPGGIIETVVTRKAGKLSLVTIGGEVILKAPLDRDFCFT